MPSIVPLLTGKSHHEKVAIQVAAVSALKPTGMYENATYGLTVEIQNIRKSTFGLEVFARAWRSGKQLGFGIDGSVEIERFRFQNAPIAVVDPAGNIEQTWHAIDGQLRGRMLREDPMNAIRQTLAHTIAVSCMDGSNITTGKLGTTTDTFFPAAGSVSPADSEGGTDSTLTDIFSVIRTATCTDVNVGMSNLTMQAGYLASRASSPNYRYMLRGLTGYNTAAVGTDVVSSATLSFYGDGAKSDQFTTAQSIVIDRAVPASASSFVGTDYLYSNCASVEQASNRVTIANWSAVAYNDFTLNATGIGNINGSGNSWFMSRLACDFDSVDPGWAASKSAYGEMFAADTALTVTDPQLVVVHAPAATGHTKNVLTLGVG